ncbi:MAG TPA: AgmX/PglI C-terminal domain-containing protein [Kofleriaceae bacterium]|nr:AgmX/PglI C-terminal domain-containing protein [Kofleriaceae bacterium]
MATPQRPQTAPAQPQMQAPRQRILRIGVLLGGKIVEERLIRERTSVSIGQSMKNTFSIPVEGLPLEFTLFVLDQGRYFLRFLNKMDGRLSEGGNVNTLDALKGRGAQNHGDYWQVPLSEQSRGKLSFGDLTVLFQFVTEPPRQPKPMLPASVRGTFADRIDPRLAVIIGAALFVDLLLITFSLWIWDPELPTGMADRAYNLTFKQDTYQVDTTPPPQTQAVAADQGSAAKKEPAKPEPAKTPAKAPDSGRDQKADIAMQEDQARAMADLLTGEGPNGNSEGDMSKRRPGADLGQQIDAVKEGGKQVAVGGGSGRGSRDNGDPRVGTGKGPNINGPGGTELAGGGKAAEHAPTGRISIAQKQSLDETNLTADSVLAKIMAAYMAGIKRCYTQYLKKDASARGKVALQFTVNETGRSTQGSAHGFAGDVDECIGGLMSSWRFPVPKDKDGDATSAQFAITLQLVPD